MNISFFNKNKCEKIIYEKDNNGREICLYKLTDCIATGINLYYPNVLLYTNRLLILPILERTMSLNSGSIYEKMNMQFDYNPITPSINYKIPVFFFIYNTDNYFHYLYDTLPYLISYFHIKQTITDLKLLMQLPNDQQNTCYTFVLEFLELLNIKMDDIVYVNKNTIYSIVYISTSYTHNIDSNLPPRKEIYNFYKDIKENVKSKFTMNTPLKIYISRRSWIHGDYSNIGTNYTARRKMINENELVEKIEKDGYKEVFTEKLSTIEKILYFANATHVIGAIGGGISNVLFSSPNTKLEAIVSPTFLDVNSRFKYSLDCVDVYYNYNTQHIEIGLFKKYMRVKLLSLNNNSETYAIGEIEEVYRDRLLVSYTDGSNTGWNSNYTFKQIEININEVEKLDNGLNSPYILNL